MKNIFVFGAIILILASGGLYVFEKSNDRKSIYVVSMTADEMSKALLNGTIQGFILWEPFPSKAVSEGSGKYLVNSKDIWKNHPSCVLAISDTINDENMMTALVWAQIKGTRFINNPENTEKVLLYGQEFSGLDRKTVAAAINNTEYIEYPDVNETKKAFDILTKAGFIKNSLTDLGYNGIDDFLSKLYVNKYYNYIKKKLDEDPEWTPPRVNGSLRFGFIEGNSHYLAMHIAKKEGYFEKVGLIEGKNIQFTGYRSGREITEAFKHRKIDVATLGTSVLLRYKIDDYGRINIISGVNSGGSSLVVGANSGINSIEDLNNKKIATSGFGTCQDTILRKMFEGFEIKTQ